MSQQVSNYNLQAGRRLPFMSQYDQVNFGKFNAGL
jgi:hypothetical protein